MFTFHNREILKLFTPHIIIREMSHVLEMLAILLRKDLAALLLFCSTNGNWEWGTFGLHI